MMHHYRESGLDTVFVDFDTFDNGYYAGYEIGNLKQLHNLITEEVITAPGLLTAPECRFLLKRMWLGPEYIESPPDYFTQRLGCDSTMIARLEKGDAIIDPTTDIRIRRMVAEKFDIEAVNSKTDAELHCERLLPRRQAPIVIRRTMNGNDCQYWVDTATPLAELPLEKAPLTDKSPLEGELARASV